jgi:hypothetical protein
MEQVKGVVKDHLEKHKFFESLKSAMSKDPKLVKLDRGQIIEKLKSEGVLSEIISQLPLNKKSSVQTANTISQSNGGQATVAASKRPRASAIHDDVDPNKRYMSLTLVKGSAFADFVNVRPDESVSVAVSFLKNRYHTRMVQCSTDPVFDETFLFEFVGENDNIKFDAATLLKLN